MLCIMRIDIATSVFQVGSKIDWKFVFRQLLKGLRESIIRGSSEDRISASTQEFFGFQWQNLEEILNLFKLYNNLGKVAVKRESLTDNAF